MKYLSLALFALCAPALAGDGPAPRTRSIASVLRAKPVRIHAAAERTVTLNYPRPGEFRNFGPVEVASSAYAQTSSELPPIADFDPAANSTGYVPSVYVPAPYTPAILISPDTRLTGARTIIRADGTVATTSFRLTPLGPQGTNRAVINQITGLPVDQ